ncbi:uncharacterized protein TrAFT101_000968 [Trichoderma asperellum]|uniref:uncharacterized protein n=1 Tax=Trichoderma asperellum TaxID=101201 RepID=UPI0033201368|nr:hypothetical protein TrAFT101_000968 [Trichoderma asperellum]
MPIPFNSEPEKPDLHPLFVPNVPAKDINIFDINTINNPDSSSKPCQLLSLPRNQYLNYLEVDLRHILAADILDSIDLGGIGLEGIEHKYFVPGDTVLGLDIDLRRDIGLGQEKGLAAGYNSSFADQAGSMPAGLEGSGCPVDNSLAGSDSDRSQNNPHLFRTLVGAVGVIEMSLRKPGADRLCWYFWEPWFYCLDAITYHQKND